MRTRLATYLTGLLVAGLTLQCVSQLSAPTPGSATHPSLTQVDSIPLSGMPFGVAISASNVVYVTRASDDLLARAVLPGTTFNSFPIGDEPSQVRISPNGQTAYVSNQSAFTVRFVNVATNTVFDTVALPDHVLTLGLSPNGTRLYALTDYSGVYVIDALEGTVIGSIPPATIGSFLTGVAFHPFLLRMYVAARDEGNVRTINTQTNALVNVATVTGGRIQNVAVSRDGSTLFATDIERSKLIVWQLASGTPVATAKEYAIGTPVSRSAFDVAVSPDNVQLYVSTLADGKVYVLDRATRALITSINTKGSPRYIAFDTPGETAVIPNEFGWVTFVR